MPSCDNAIKLHLHLTFYFTEDSSLCLLVGELQFNIQG